MELDFIEIGTANFDTLIEKSNDTTKGISIEPIKHYLDQLPNKLNVKKINCAISPTNTNGEIEIFYIPEDIIDKNKLIPWLKGCNSINNYHPQHIKQNVVKYVTKERVKEIPIKTILLENNVQSINVLKVDTEGCDADILINLYDIISVNKNLCPNTIIFETKHSEKEKINKVIDLYRLLKYEIIDANKTNTTLRKPLEL